MIITFSDGSKRDGRIYTHTGSRMRVAVDGFDDLVEFTQVSNQWLSENCEPVSIQFAWENVPPRVALSEEDFICCPSLAYKLLRRLFSETDDAQPQTHTSSAS